MDTNYPSINPEIWGGLECTINRIGDSFRNQLIYAGHYEREDDIDKIAQLGITALRYPVLWEAHQFSSTHDEKINWTKTKQNLEKIREYKITPIAGLVHHGSGPKFTGLFENDFANKLADYAFKVACEFSWLEYYTPVNEPLTTARFSGLYGCWFPHHKNDLSFTRMLLNQLKGIVLSMQAIRKVNPAAKLIQTEDLAKVHSSPTLQYQSDFENERRWLTYDILCGKLNHEHFFWRYFIDLGIDEAELYFFLENPCIPAITGFNYYVTSERYLDENIEEHPESAHGGNGRHQYVDVAAVRATKPAGLKSLLQEAWERYQLPLALTEVHMNCTREEQLRWFKESWDTCCALKRKGVPVVAITAWSLLGAYDWNSLLMREENNYEAGIFDITEKVLRPTAVAQLVTALAKTGSYQHPVINEAGWWHRSYPGNNNLFSNSKITPLFILGSGGTLGNAFVRICEGRSIPHCAFSHAEMDITDIHQIEKAIEMYKPWAIINASGYVRVDAAESDAENCFKINSEAPGNLAAICYKHGIQLMTFSSDLVFDGEKQAPYIEGDLVKPLNIYGKSKARGELLVLQQNPAALIIRTSAFFGPWDKYNFPFQILNSLKEKQHFTAVKDVIISPTYVPDLVDKALDLLIDAENGIWHLTNDGMLTWYDFAEQVALRGGYRNKNFASCLQEEMEWKAKRPTYSVLQSNKGIKLPSLHHAIERFFEEKII